MTLANQVLMMSFPLLTTLYTQRYVEQDKLRAFPPNPASHNLPMENSYDFIVVGAGMAGCVVARRLVDAGFNVLLLEAGGNPPPIQAVTNLWWYNNELPEINFVYRSVPQKKMALAYGGLVAVSGGKMMGGSSSHYAGVYERGSPIGYDEWATFTGDSSWRYANLLPFFKMSEKYRGSFKDKNDQHGKDGPMPVTTNDDWPDPARSTWIQAGQELGYPIVDTNGPQRVGFSYTQLMSEFGQRVSTYTAYVKPIERRRRRRGRGRLTIQRYSFVTKILMENKRATGVLYKRHGIPMVARATKEVIVSASTFQTPVLLIRSGIGPKDELAKVKVDPVAILPVGYNYMDHMFYFVNPITVTDSSIRWQMDSNLTFSAIRTYVKTGKGGLGFPSLGEAFIASSRAVKKENQPNWPDLQIYFLSHPIIPDSMLCLIELCRPLSRGRLTVNVTGPNDEEVTPLIDPNYFGDESDYDVVLEGIDLCLKVIEKTKTMKKVGLAYPKWSFPACQDKPYRSREYWICHINQLGTSGYHVTGTARMGRQGEKSSVVDSRLKVLGVKGLRVIDASIMPRSVNANTGAATMMIAEKGASMIIQAYKKKSTK